MIRDEVERGGGGQIKIARASVCIEVNEWLIIVSREDWHTG